MNYNHIGCEYLVGAVKTDTRKYIVKRIVEKIKELNLDFDAIAFRGMSGAIIAPIVANELNKDLLMVRKSDGNHSGFELEGNRNSQNYIIIDDLIATGKTINSILSVVKNRTSSNCLGIFLYAAGSDFAVNKTFATCTLPVWHLFCYDME